MRPNPCYVVGYGLVDGLGANPDECWAKMIDNTDYTKHLEHMGDNKHNMGMRVDDSKLIMPPEITPKIASMYTRAQHMAYHSVKQALEMSGLRHSTNVAVIISSISNDAEFFTRENAERFFNGKRVSPFKVANRGADAISSAICITYNFQGMSFAIHATCTSAGAAIDYGMRIADEYDYVIVGGSDAATYEMGIRWFEVLNALGNKTMPFDDDRSGFLMGEGAGILILQTEEKAKEFGSKKYAKLYPMGMATDAKHPTDPDPEGTGAKISIAKAMEGFTNGDIDAVCAHATSTPNGDPIEYNVTSKNVPNVPIWAPKSKIGHTLGAATAVELIYCILALQNKKIPHIQNLENCSFDEHGTLVRTNKEIKTNRSVVRMLNNSFGFGGKCSSQVVEVEV